MTDVKIIGFLGMEIIAEVIKEDAKSITVKNPLRIVIVPNKANPQNPNVGFAPYCEWTTDKELVLSKNLFVFTAEPLPMFTQNYKAQFSGLILPDAQPIVT